MTSPVVTVNVALVRGTVRPYRTMIGGFAGRVLTAAGLTAENVTALNGQRALELLRSRPTELPKAVVAAALVESLAKLAAVSNAVLNIATYAEQLDSELLSWRAVELMNALTRVIAFIDNALRRLEEATSGMRGLGEISDWMRFAAFVAILSGGGFIIGGLILVFAELVDKIDGLDSDAAEAARVACETQARSTGRPCTPEQYAAFFADERTREREDSLTNKVTDAVSSIGRSVGGAFSGALFWLLLIGGVGTTLYFTAPYLGEKAVETTSRYAAARARAKAKELPQ